MDKETLSNYGWIVVLVLILSVLLALASPFGNFIAGAIKSTTAGFFQVNQNALGAAGIDIVYTPEQLQAKYKFEYYSTMNLAVTDVNNGTIGENADVNKADAVAGVYTDENDTPVVVLLRDTVEPSRLMILADMTINLGGKKLLIEDKTGILTYLKEDSTYANITIDGRIPGSTVEAHNADKTAAISLGLYGTAIIKGGTYIGNTEGSPGTAAIVTLGHLTISDATILVSETSGLAAAIQTHPGGTTIMNNCHIIGNATTGKIYGIDNKGNLTMNYCDVLVTATGDGNGVVAINNYGVATVNNTSALAYSNYGSTADNNGYTSSSLGINNARTLSLNNSHVFGTHSGVGSYGTIYVNGGVYEGYGHGGFYFSGPGTTAYVRNATTRKCPMPDGYTTHETGNGAGFYIGGNAGQDNITVYMDNCDIYGDRQPIVLRGTSGEQNNSLYISNSNINLDYTRYGIRIDNDTHKLYLGSGNNFTADDTSLPDAVVATDETYIMSE